jgi:hypothetical protein
MKNKKTEKNKQGGFVPLLIIAIIAILAIGGGAYFVAKKNKENQAQQTATDNTQTEANANADVHANVNANLDVNANLNAKATGSFRSLMALGRNTECTFSGTNKDTTSSGTVFITSTGEMRGDFTSTTSAGAKTSSMILTGGQSYVWSGTQGAKMSASFMGSAGAGTQAQSQQPVDLDSQVDYNCQPWTVDQSKFVLPTGVNFVDIEAMMKASSTLPTGKGWNGTIKGKTQ